MFDETIASPIQKIEDEITSGAGVELYIKREDLIDAIISGNKYRKLKYNLIEAKEKGYQKILTFGGAYSNHIHAMAYAGAKYDFDTIGVIRGEAAEPLNPTLKDAQDYGMHLHYVSRATYREKSDPRFLNQLQERFGEFCIVPEGGSNGLAVKGCMEILKGSERSFDYYCCACGTGGTLAGIIASLNGHGQVIGYPALKNADFLYDTISNLTATVNRESLINWRLQNTYYFGGYAKYSIELIDFINNFKARHNIQLDPVYTGKMMFGIYDELVKTKFQRGSKILAIHTGGLQGIRGFNLRFGNLIND